jgi:hypothetical protein
MAIVSAMYGAHDQVMLPSCPDRIHCVFGTDSSSITSSKGWHVDRTPYHTQLTGNYSALDADGKYSWGNIEKYPPEVHGVMAAKFYKMNAHLLPDMPGFDIILWMDAHFWRPGKMLNPDLLENFRKYLQHSTMIVPMHEDRDTVAAEVVPAGLRADSTTGIHTGVQDAQEALEHARSDSFTDDQGLFWCGIFA